MKRDMAILEEMGYNTDLENHRKNRKLDSFDVGRIISEHKERYIVKTADLEYDAEIIGNLRYAANSRSDFPAVGDWVAITEYDDHKALIHAVYPRKTMIERQAVGKQGEKQIIATNIDHAFIMQAVDRDFNINRIERYLTICYSSRVNPIIVLTKIDLLDEHRITELVESVHQRIKNIPVFAISNETQTGIQSLQKLIEKGKTYCMLGSSGVGKSTLMNNLSGRNIMQTDAISQSTKKGRHITSHRELIVLDKGGILIDNPGMREVGIVDTGQGLESAFDTLIRFSQNCKFTDCTHTSETGCSVLEAVKNGELDRSTYENYLKIEREKEHFEMTVSEKRKKDKAFGKMVRSFKQDIQKISTKHNKRLKP
jgi:ribosome biogenesis GTPase